MIARAGTGLLLVASCLMLASCGSAGGQQAAPADELSTSSTTSSSTVEDSVAATTATPELAPTDSVSADDFSVLTDVIDALVMLPADAATFGLADVVRTSPRMSMRGSTPFEHDGFLGLAIPLAGSCAWFLTQAHNLIEIAETQGTECDGSPSLSFSTTGDNIGWAPLALEIIDGVPRARLEQLVADFKKAVLVDHRDIAPAEFAAVHGLQPVASSQGADQVALGIEGGRLVAAIAGQSGACYVAHAEVSSNTTVRFGVAEDCTAAGALASADSEEWPQPG